MVGIDLTALNWWHKRVNYFVNLSKVKTCIGNILERKCISVCWMKLTKQRYPIVEGDTIFSIFLESVMIVTRLFQKMPDHFIWRT